ncbi:CBS domain-containing protein [Streptomyces tropicalis]|uniref:CBS domain-containing protein n=1 Tax=Streptomyces tropicalis TaxID=3034234 RepID=A0ABT6A3A2_9ACTN|nr:CBS domain-containing protein [Streptomyces tropicalis]MDF3299123.1 CBS domain-containing protein [Streptomyces tropicalis]
MQGSRYTVNDVMTSTVVALARGAAFKEIVRTMEQWGVSAMPVLDGRGRVLGVVSEADLLRKEEFRVTDPDARAGEPPPTGRAKAGAVTAEELMTRPAVTVHADATLARAAAVMARHQVKRLPVVDDDGALKGIVSRSDLLRIFLRSDEDIADEIRHEIAAARFPVPLDGVRVDVREGVVTLGGRVADPSLIPLAVRLVRSVEGVVDVRCALAGPRRRPVLEPDLTTGAASPGPRGRPGSTA